MKLILLVLVFSYSAASAQHCPWDCTGFIMIRTDVTREEMKKMHPTLVDGNKQVVVDTLYGSGKKTFDSCNFLRYDDFVKYRVQRMKIHSWYAYDTMLNFAQGYYVVHYNYCKYKKDNANRLYIKYNDPSKKQDHYIEVPVKKRIHLHDQNSNIRAKNYDATLKEVEPLIMVINRKDWGL